MRRSQDGQGQDVRGCGPTLSVVSRPETQYSPVCSISCLDTSPAGIQARPVSTPVRLLLRSQKTGHIFRITLPLQGPAKQTCRPDSSYSRSRPVAQHPAGEVARRIACSIPNSQDPPKRGDSGVIDWNFVWRAHRLQHPNRQVSYLDWCLDWWMASAAASKRGASISSIVLEIPTMILPLFWAPCRLGLLFVFWVVCGVLLVIRSRGMQLRHPFFGRC